jgi:hypothetical protein
MFYNLTVNTFHANLDNREFTEPESPLNKFRVLTIKLSEISSKIPETPIITFKNLRYE